jgi:uncharacterized membrane protein
MEREDRLELLERRTQALSERLRRLEGWVDGGYIVTRAPEPWDRRPAREPERVFDYEHAPTPVRQEPRERVPVARDRTQQARPRPAQPRRPARQRPQVAVEDLLGGRVLAWLGGIAVLVGIVFFFALAISHGWIGPAARTLIAGGGALLLLGAGIWLHDHKGRTDAALATVSTAVAGLFATVTVASQVYDLVPAVAGLFLVAAVGVLATTLALRWESRGVAALGIGGTLLAPALVGAPSSTSSMVFLLIASAAASGVLLWQRWDWLAFGAFAATTPQWIGYLLHDPSPAAALTVLACFGALNVAAAIGFELRVPTERLRLSSTFLLALNALVLATVGWFWLSGNGHHTLGEVWLIALAVLHLGVGLSERKIKNVSHDLGLVSLVLGVSVADVAYGLIVHGPALAVGWAGAAVGFAIIKRRSRDGSHEAMLAQVGLGVHIGLALVRTLFADAPPSALTGDDAGLLSAAVALSALAASCFVSARIAEEGKPELRIALDGLGLAALAYMTALLVDGPALTLAWAAEAAALAKIGRRSKDAIAQWGAVAFVSLAGAYATLVEAPPKALVYGVDNVLAVAGALVAVGAVSLLMGHLATCGKSRRPAFYASAAFMLLYAASIAIVSAFQPGTPGAELSIFDIGTRQTGQVFLSAMWAFVGVSALLVGLRRDIRGLRVGALGLLGVAVGKVFLYDLATLTSVYRVVSFVGLGLLLLAGAFAWQRMRPRPLPDLRETPKAVR